MNREGILLGSKIYVVDVQVEILGLLKGHSKVCMEVSLRFVGNSSLGCIGMVLLGEY